MGSQPQLRTERLLLRRWLATDLEPLAAINADAAVMEHFPAPLSAVDSAALVERIERCFDERGYGLWAVEVREQRALAGFVGLAPVDAELAFAPAVEVGWRLARPYWGRGIATEAAIASIAFAFDELGLPSLVSYTAARNLRSRRVMERLGMRRDPAEDFIHPGVPAGHPLAPHVLYRLEAHARP
ncbi:MAG: GNAT family N-acetyltransferase [Solirubrobacteraceae bacterium]